MMDDSIDTFPFYNVTTQIDLFNTLYPKLTASGLLKSSNLPVFNPHTNEDIEDNECSFDWNNTNSQYITTDELNELNYANQDTKSISILQINCRSLQKHFNDLKLLLSNANICPSVIAVSETWLSTSNHHLYNLPGYSFISLPRDNRRGGGVGIYIANELSFRQRDDYMQIMNTTCEYIVIEILRKNKASVLVTSLYRPPNTDLTEFNTKFSDFLNLITSGKFNHIFIAGDTNIDLLKTNTHKNSDQFFTNLCSYGFLPSILKPTRITEHTSSLIDNIFSNCTNLAQRSHIIYDDVSDHLPTYLITDLSQPNNQPTQTINTRDFSAKNYDSYFRCLKETTWTGQSAQLATETDINNAYSSFSIKLTNIINKSFPYKDKSKNKSKNTNLKPWLTASLIKCCRKKSRLQKKYTLNPSTVNKAKYTSYRNQLKIILKKAEKEHYQNLLIKNTNNIRNTWKILNEIIN